MVKADVLMFNVTNVSIKLVAIPEHNKRRMVLGMNFIKTAGIVLDFNTGT